MLKTRTKAGLVGLGMGAVALILLFLLPGAGETNKEMMLKNEINIPYFSRILLSYAPNQKIVEKQYGKPDIVRKERDYTYEIREMSDGSKLISFFHPNGGHLTDEWRLKGLPERSEFEVLVPGQTLAQDVKRIDPYFRIITDPTKVTGQSEHRLRDSGAAIVVYKNVEGRWIVESIRYMEEDPSGFVSKLRAEDRAAFCSS